MTRKFTRFYLKNPAGPFQQATDALHRKLIVQALRKHRNLDAAAHALGLHRVTLKRHLGRLGLKTKLKITRSFEIVTR